MQIEGIVLGRCVDLQRSSSISTTTLVRARVPSHTVIIEGIAIFNDRIYCSLHPGLHTQQFSAALHSP